MLKKKKGDVGERKAREQNGIKVSEGKMWKGKVKTRKENKVAVVVNGKEWN